MHYKVPMDNGEVVVGKDYFNYREVIKDFSNAKNVRIVTYNISKKDYKNELLDELKNLSSDVDLKIVSNIPSRMPCYYNSKAGDNIRKNSKKNIGAYLDRLNPENFVPNTEVGFNFNNHAKIIATENIMYIGSANYSDESQSNIESGTIIRDKQAIQKIINEIFPKIMNESTPYYEDDFNVFRLFAISMENKFAKWLKWFDKELIWKREGGIKRVQEPFKFDSEDLESLHADIEELQEFEILIENTYSENDEDYNELINRIMQEMKEICIEFLLDFTITDSDFFNYLVYDKDKRIDELIQNDPDAYDENLDACIERAMDIVQVEYVDMSLAIEADIVFLRDQMALIIRFLKGVRKRTLEYSNRWIVEKVDNT